LAFHTVGSTTYLYVGEAGQVVRIAWRPGETRAGQEQVLLKNLPYGPTADGDTHPLKDLAFSPDGHLYVGFGSSCNVCTGDGSSKPVRAAIYRFNADGSGEQLVARGLRNPEGLAFVPGTSTLWTAVNERDNIAYPFADTTGQYGKLVTSYINNHPPDELTSVQQGADYGWPYCNPDPDTTSGYDMMPFDADYQFNPGGHVVNCTTMNRIVKGIPAHSAPLGLTFLQGTKFAASYRSGAFVALHGSWDRSSKTGYKVVYFPWVQDKTSGHPGALSDFVSGWLNASTGSDWDRPVDAVVDAQGDMFISADASGTVYLLTYHA
jgi:glucose/arabinose dehydrogenase